jgi:hypothetical protein
MRTTIKKFILAILLTNLHSVTSAQGIKDNLFVSLGFSTVLDYAVLPPSNTLLLVELNNQNQLVGYYQSYSAHSVSYFTYAAKLRFNVLNIGDNSSLSLHVQPALGVSYSQNTKNDETFWGSLSIPMMAGFNFGNVASRKTEKRNGFGVAAGIEYYIGGLINNGAYSNTFTYKDAAGQNAFITSSNGTETAIWLSPAFELSYRFFTRSERAHEVSFLGSFGKTPPLKTDPQFQVVIQDGSTTIPMHLRIMYSIYLGY